MSKLFDDVYENLPAYYDKLILATAALDKASRDHEDAKANYESAKLTGLANGTIEGKNEILREANAREVLNPLYEQAVITGATLDAVRANYNQMRLQCDKWSRMLRLLEVEAKAASVEME